MKLKASLHIHTKEDRMDGHMINYDAYRLIDEAARCGFQVLGYTPHQKFVFKQDFADYAASKGILLIPGIELNLGKVFGNHVIILNCGRSAENIHTFRDLAAYKSRHPEAFVLCPHPAYSRLFSVGIKNLKKYISLFDAIEHSWLYTPRLNANRKAGRVADKHSKPMIATSDVHYLKKLNMDYATIEADDLSTAAVFRAIRRGSFENETMPKKLWNLIAYLVFMYAKYYFLYVNKYKLTDRPSDNSGQEEFVPVMVESDNNN